MIITLQRSRQPPPLISHSQSVSQLSSVMGHMRMGVLLLLLLLILLTIHMPSQPVLLCIPFYPPLGAPHNVVVLSAVRRPSHRPHRLKAQGSGCSSRKPIPDGLFNPSTSLRLTRRIPLGPEEDFPFASFGWSFRRCAQGCAGVRR